MDTDIGFGRFVGARVLTLVLVLLAAATLPWMLGGVAERSFRAMLASWAADAGWQVVDIGFQRGWTSSRAHAELAGPQGSGLRLSSEHELDHGPFAPSGATDRRSLAPPVIATASSTLRLHSPTPTAIFEADSVLGIDGRLRTRLSSTDGLVELPRSRLQWQGMRARFRAVGPRGSPRLAVEADEVAWQAGRERIRAEDLALVADGGLLPETGRDAIYSARARQFVHAGRGIDYRLDDLHIESAASRAGEFVALSLQGRFDGGAASATRLDSGVVEIGLEGFDPRAITEAREAGAGSRAAATGGPAGTAAFIAAVLASNAELLLMARVDLAQSAARLNLSMDGGDQEPRGSGHLRLPAVLVAQYAARVIDGELDKLQDRGLLPPMSDPQRARAVAEAAARRVGEWTREGWLLRDGDAFEARIAIGDDRLLLNGRPALALPSTP